MVSVDFFLVPTIRFQILYVFLVLAHDRRRIVHCGVTEHPTAEWTAQQLREAFPWDKAPRYLLRDRDHIFGREFIRASEGSGRKARVIGAAIAVAKGLSRAAHRVHSSRVFRPDDCLRRTLLVPHAHRVCLLLP